jgi:Prp8 binding protein
MSKRGASPPPGGVLIKRVRSSSPQANNQIAISSSNNEREQGLIRTVKRTSGLEAPIISLTGSHGVCASDIADVKEVLTLNWSGQAEIMSCRFDPSGQNIAACSADRGVCACLLPPKRVFLLTITRDTALWKTYAPNTNYGLLSSVHKAPILDLRWSLFSPLLYTASADHTMNITDLTTGTRVRRLRAHRGIINSLDRTLAGAAGTELLVSGSDDGTVRVWEGGDEGNKQPVAVFELGCPVTSVCWSADGANIYAGALDNEIHVSMPLYYIFLLLKP